MKLLSRSPSKFREWFKTAGGLRFQASILPLTDGNATTTTYLEPRLVLHTKPHEQVEVGETVFDPTGRVFLLARHDERSEVRRVFRLFQLTEQVSWKRSIQQDEPITGLPMGIGEQEIGPIWVASEIYGREDVDRVTHIGMDRARIITGAALRLNDKVRNLAVVRLSTVYGVNVAETQ